MEEFLKQYEPTSIHFCNCQWSHCLWQSKIIVCPTSLKQPPLNTLNLAWLQLEEPTSQQKRSR